MMTFGLSFVSNKILLLINIQMCENERLIFVRKSISIYFI